MTKFKFASKMHLLTVLISAIIIVAGLVVGLVCHFTSGNYFNFSAEYKQYNTVEVNYVYVDYPEADKVITICDGKFKDAGVKYFSKVTADTDEGGKVVFKFAKSVKGDKLAQCASNIEVALNGSDTSNLSSAAFHTLDTQLNGGKVFIRVAIAVASAIVLHCAVYAIFYGIATALSLLVVDVHGVAVYVSLLSLLRIPVGSSLAVFGVATVFAVMAGSAYYFERYRRNSKKEANAKCTSAQLVTLSEKESLVNAIASSVGVAVAGLVVLVLMSISALSLSLVLSSALVALVSAVTSVCSTAFFAPAVHSCILQTGENLKNRTKEDKK